MEHVDVAVIGGGQSGLAAAHSKVCWTDGSREEADAIVPATGYRPELPYPAGLDGALHAAGRPRHRVGASAAVPGPAFVGPEWQRSLSSNSLRGVGRDVDRIARRVAAHLRGR
ncbi:hypothetical protein [Streptomyces sp. C10-9-1]|uniref:hypothetical protein n=1 Tax=Streptomyces sp. C10-9-1 TaxID=1859285 RepID=UPI003D70D2DF